MRTDGIPDTPTSLPDVTHDAVVVIPGLMGSELRDRATDTVIWGLNDAGWLARAWTRRDGMAQLALTDAELDALADGTYQAQASRLYPARLLRFPTAAPFLNGFEPYTSLVKRIQGVVADPAAILEFAYDWRLPVEFNTRLLADTIARHLTQWRQHLAEHKELGAAMDPRDVRVILVAHSMGGLLARGLSLIPGATDDIRTTITLGTPFYGSVKATVLLNTGSGAPVPVPHQRLRAVAATLPGLHDLLPTYRCLFTTTSTGVEDVVRLTPADIATLGGSKELTEAAFAYHDRLETVGLVGHRAVVGVQQPTLQSLRLDTTTVVAQEKSYVWDGGDLLRDDLGRPLHKDYRGDGTVHRYAASPLGTQTIPVAQQHGALAASSEVADYVCAILTDRGSLGIKLGAGEIGLAVPDVVTADEPFEVLVTGDDDPAAVTCVVQDAGPDWEQVAAPRLSARRDLPGLTTEVRLPGPGVFRVAVKTGGSDPVTQLILCVPTESPEDA